MDRQAAEEPAAEARAGDASRCDAAAAESDEAEDENPLGGQGSTRSEDGGGAAGPAAEAPLVAAVRGGGGTPSAARMDADERAELLEQVLQDRVMERDLKRYVVRLGGAPCAGALSGCMHEELRERLIERLMA
eukprot:2084508-Prymnesium_polylepis.1